MSSISIDLSDRVVLITGGTQGIGRATAITLSKAGARVFVTCKWNSADTAEFAQAFRDADTRPATIVEADVKSDEDTEALLDTIAAETTGVDVFVSNVGFAPLINTLDDYKKRSFFQTVEYSSWPLIEYTRRIQKRFGRYPTHIIGVSSDGPDHYYRGYDYVSAAKALMEHFARYLAAHLWQHGTRVNVVRFGAVHTASFDAIFGRRFFEFAKANGMNEGMELQPQDCADTILALCSGLMNAMNGQVITVDHGHAFKDNLMMRYLDAHSEEA